VLQYGRGSGRLTEIPAGDHMLHWLVDTNLWDQALKVLGALTAAIAAIAGLLTAWTSLRKGRTPDAAPKPGTSGPDQPQPGSNPHRFRVLSLQGEPVKPWSLFWFKCLTIAGCVAGLLMTAEGVWAFILRPSTANVLAPSLFGSMLILTIFSARRLWTIDPEKGSRVRREATIHAQGDYDHVWDQCLEALRRINVKIKTFDASKGRIEGTTGLTWKTYGEIVAVQVTRISNDECAVQIRSDSKLSALVLDYGKNSSNIERFFQQLTG
jgi:hypothetical protein